MRHIGEVIKTMPTGDGGRALGRDGEAAARPFTVQHSTLLRARQVPVYRHDGRRIGIVKGDCFYKVVQGSKHLLRRPEKAWAFSLGVLHQAARLGAVTVQVCDVESGRVYRATIRDIWTRGFPVTYDPNDDQIALPLEYWEVSGGAEARQLRLGEDNGDER